MSQHTPGPWGTIWIDGTYVVDANGGKTDIAHVLNRGNPDTTEANARLIAAAPELLTMLRRFYEATYGKTDLISLLDFEHAREAIAKATGA